MQKYRRISNDERLTALGKGIAVLEAVVDQPQGVGLPDLAARLDLPRQTVHRVLVRLEADGLLVRIPGRERYAVGPRLSRLALAALASRNQGAPVRAVLQELVDDLGETCNIGVLEGLDYVYLERIECEWPLRLHIEAGDRVPAHCIAGGKLLLAHLEPKDRKRLLKSRKLVARTTRTITRVPALEAEFARMLEAGFATNDQENLEGIVAAAVPIRNRAGRVFAALTVHGPVPRLTLETCRAHVPRLARAATRIAQVWGLD
jgi:DNA-binding IclR family transcriptional regulator